METEEVVIIDIHTDKAINSVKDLKQYISALRDDLVKTEKGTDEYNKALDELVKSQKVLTDVMRAGQNEVKAAAGSYNALQNEMTALRKVWKETTDEAKRNEIGQRIGEINTQLKEMDASIGNYQRQVGSYRQALESLNGTYSNQRQELAALKKALDQLDPSSKEYEQAFNRAAEITHNLSDRQERLKYASTDLGDQLSNIRGIATNMVAGFSAVNAAMGLFGQESEDVQKAMLKVQQAMALVQGMQGLDGFLKRTQGLSTAMKVWLSDSKAITKQTKAQTAATNAQTVATEGAEVAQKGLNAAMKSNPIGLIIIAITTLVALFTKFKKQIVDFLGGAEKLNSVLAKVKATLLGVANVIAKPLLVPLKEVINLFKTFAKVVQDAFAGNWGKIADDLKNGINESIDIVKDGYDVMGNYNEAYNSSIEKSDEKALQKKNELRAKDLEDEIATNDAKYDSDWKYTESGKTLYQEYLNSKIASYKQDTKEYKNAINEKLSYDRDLAKYEKKQKEDAEKADKERREKAAKAAEDAKKKLETIEKNYQSQIQKNYGTSIRETINSYKEQLSTLDEFYSLQLKLEPNKDIKKVLEEQIKIIRDTYKEFSNQNIFQLETDAMVPDINTEPEKTKKRLEKELAGLMTVFNSVLNDAKKKGYNDTLKKINDNVVTIFKADIQQEINNQILEIQKDISSKTIELDFDIEFGDASKVQEKEIEKLRIAHFGLIEQIEAEKELYQQIVNFVDENNLTPSDQYDEAKRKLEELNIQLSAATLNYKQNLAAINTEGFNKQIAEVQTITEKAIQDINKNVAEKEAGKGWFKLLQPVSVEEEQKYLDDIYNEQVKGLENLKALWQERANDENLTNEQRVEAKQNVAELEMQIDDLELQHMEDNTEKRKALFQQYYTIASDTITSVGNLFGSLSDAYEANIEAQVKANKMSEKEADRQFENVKGLRVAEAVMNTIAGSVGAFMQASATYPAPYGPILGGITAASVLASGFAQIKQIQNTSRSSSSNGSSASVSAPTYNEMPTTFVSNVTSESDIDNLRNALTDSLNNSNIRAYVVESDISDAQKKTNKRNSETSF